MKREEFLHELEGKLHGLSKRDIAEQLSFYGEMIADRVEDGMTEYEAIAEIGSADSIARRIKASRGIGTGDTEAKARGGRMSGGTVALLVLGSPLWLPLLIAAFSVGISLLAVLWSLVVSLWAVFLALAVCPIGGAAVCIIGLIGGNAISGLAMLSAGIFAAGAAIFMFFACKVATRGAFLLTRQSFLLTKKCFTREVRA